MVKKVSLALEVLGLNIAVFPHHADSYVKRAKLYQQTGVDGLAKEDLVTALSIEPEHASAAKLLASLT